MKDKKLNQKNIWCKQKKIIYKSHIMQLYKKRIKLGKIYN